MKSIVEAGAGASARTKIAGFYRASESGEDTMKLRHHAVELLTGVRPAKPRFRTATCFDVFDTVLTRAVGHPKDVFLLLGNRLLHEGRICCSAEIFARHRAYAEERALSIVGKHPTIRDIYREVVGSLSMSEDEIDTLAAAELSLERELARTITTAEQLVKQARQRTGRIIFATDTNMPAGFIQSILAEHGLWESEDSIVASCEAGVDKARGTMFPHIARQLGLRPWRIKHHGNDAVADIRNGRLSGWKVKKLPEGNLSRYEQALVAQSFATGGVSSLLAGASRLARISTEPQSEREQVLREVAAGVMAPTLTAWMLWTLHRAAAKGCRRLYFISRDGQVLLKIAQQLESVLHTGLELRYLYGSRRALQFAASPHAALRDCMRLQVCTVNDIADMFGKPTEMLVDILPVNLRDSSKWNDNLAALDRSEVLRSISDDAFQSRFGEWSDNTKNLLFAYLRQEGWEDDVPFALIDVGWRASMAGALTTALRGSRMHLPATYLYFGLGEDAYQVAGTGISPLLDAWFFDDAGKGGYLPYLASTSSLIEMFCAGSHGAVIGYEQKGNEIVPKLRSEFSPMQEWGLPILWKATADFVEAFTRTMQGAQNIVNLDVDLRHGIRDILQLFWLRPSRLEVKYWGTFPAEVNLNQTCVRALAGAVRTREIVNAVFRQRKLRAEHTWPTGTAIASPLPYRLLLQLFWRVRAKLPRLRRRAAWMKARVATMVGGQ